MAQVHLSDLVFVSPTYHTEVNIRADFDDLQKIQGYVPNQASRTALESIVTGLRPTSEKRAHLLTGQYGTGKSHFGLVLAALLRKLPEAQIILDKVREKDSEKSDLIERHLKATPGKFLVVVPSIHGYSGGFDRAILAALEDALAREKITFRPQSHFNRAIETIERWKQEGDRNPQDNPYAKLETALAPLHHTTPDILKDGLRKYSEEAYRIFEEAHQKVAYGAAFDPEAGADPREIYAQTVRYLRNTGEWEGIWLICDEFGDYLSEIAKDQNSRDSRSIQEFTEFCKRTKENQVHFVVIAHQSLGDYAAGTMSREEWQKIAGRFIGNEYSLTNVDNRHEVVELIGTVILRQTRTEAQESAWQDIQSRPDLAALLDDLQNAALYPEQPRQWLQDTLILGCFPLHPITTFCLPWLAQKVGQRERTLFSFLGDDSEGGLRRFVKDAPLIKNGKLNLYTPDMLVAYFGSAAEAKAREPEYRRIMRANREAIAAVGANPLSRRIVNALTVFQIVGADNIPPTESNLIASLHLSPVEKEEARKLLHELSKVQKIIRQRPNGFYELRERDEVDPDDLVRRAKDELLRAGFDPIAVLNELQDVREKLSPIVATSYQRRHFMTREAVRRVVLSAHLSYPKSFVEEIESWYQPRRKSYAGDLLILYVLTETSDDIEQARLYAMEVCRHPQLVIAIPKTPPKLTELLLELAAARKARLALASPAEGQDTVIEELDLRVKDLGEETQKAMDAFLRADNLTWHCNGDARNRLEKGAEEGYVSELLESRFQATPAVKDADVVNIPRGKPKTKKYRQDAMTKLLGTKGPIDIQKLEGPADDRILRACLKDTELLEKKADKGKFEAFEVRDDAPPNSELKPIWDLLKTELLKESVPLGPVIRRLLSPPYGLSHQLIEILLAAFFRNRIDEFVIFGNMLHVTKKSDRGLIERVEISAEIVTDIVANPDNYALMYYHVRPSERAYLERILSLIGSEHDPGAVSIWHRTRDALVNWFSNLPPTTVSSASRQEDQCIRRLAEVLGNPQGPENAKELLRDRLPAAFGIEMSSPPTDAQAQAALRELERCHQWLNDFAERQAMSLVGELIGLFGGSGHTYDDLRQAVKGWYNGLSESQRAHRFSNEAQHLRNVVEAEGEIKERMLVRLPRSLGLGPYTDWTENQTRELFLTKVRLAKNTIESYQPPISSGTPHKQVIRESGLTEGESDLISDKVDGADPTKEVKAEIRDLLSRKRLSTELLVRVLKELLAEFES